MTRGGACGNSAASSKPSKYFSTSNEGRAGTARPAGASSASTLELVKHLDDAGGASGNSAASRRRLSKYFSASKVLVKHLDDTGRGEREEGGEQLLLLRRRRLLERVEREEAGYFGKQPVVLQRDRESPASSASVFVLLYWFKNVKRQAISGSSQLCCRETESPASSASVFVLWYWFRV
jgi:hypothetical protein